MTFIEYLHQPDSMAQIQLLYQFGVVKQAQYVHCQVILAYIEIQTKSAKITDKECAIILAENPHYALSEDRIADIIKHAKKNNTKTKLRNMDQKMA